MTTYKNMIPILAGAAVFSLTLTLSFNKASTDAAFKANMEANAFISTFMYVEALGRSIISGTNELSNHSIAIVEPSGSFNETVEKIGKKIALVDDPKKTGDHMISLDPIVLGEEVALNECKVSGVDVCFSMKDIQAKTPHERSTKLIVSELDAMGYKIVKTDNKK